MAQHKNNPQSLQIAIQNIVPHAFSKHQNCDDVWCHYRQDPASCEHNGLPFGKYLHGDELQKAWTTVLLSIQQMSSSKNLLQLPIRDAVKASIMLVDPKILKFDFMEAIFELLVAQARKMRGMNMFVKLWGKLTLHKEFTAKGTVS